MPVLPLFVLAVAVVAVGCGEFSASLQGHPTAAPSVPAARMTVLVVLRSSTRLSRDLEQAENLAISDGTMPLSADPPFQARLRAYTSATQTAVAQIASGRVRSRSDLTVVLGPVVQQIQRLADLVETVTEVRSSVWMRFQALRDVLIDGLNQALGQPVFGAPLFARAR